MDFKALGERAAAVNPMSVRELDKDRVLLVDGDGVAYYCAGRDGTSVGEARARALDFINTARISAGAGRVKILLTGKGSHKGYRYAIARVKPYQGQRSNSRRPENWAFLRDFLENGDHGFEVQITYTAEADDLFSQGGTIFTQDKDMRMLPGEHQDWKTFARTLVGKDDFEVLSFDKVFGRKWFYLQMLHGDTADNIPGLPKYVSGYDKAGEPKFSLIGEVTAGKELAGIETDSHAFHKLVDLYKGYYKERWPVEMLEQGILLWMRRDPEDVFDVVKPGGGLQWLPEYALDYKQAVAEIQSRIDEAKHYAALQAPEGE